MHNQHDDNIVTHRLHSLKLESLLVVDSASDMLSHVPFALGGFRLLFLDWAAMSGERALIQCLVTSRLCDDKSASRCTGRAELNGRFERCKQTVGISDPRSKSKRKSKAKQSKS